MKFIKNYFKLEYNRTTIKTEVMAGLTAYFTMVYLLFLVPDTIMQAFPHVISSSGEIMGEAFVVSGVTASTMITALTVSACIAAGLASILMGIFVNMPFAQGPSLACTTFLVYTVCLNMGYTFYETLALVFVAGLVFLIMTLIGLEDKIQESLPNNIKYAVTCGIGLFISFIGFQKAHIIMPDGKNIVKLFNVTDLSHPYTKSALLALAGVVFITVLLKKHVHGAILIGKIVCIVLAIPLGLANKSFAGEIKYNLSISPVFLKMDFKGIFVPKLSNGFGMAILSVIIIVVSICVIDVFETIGTLIATDIFLTINSHKEDNPNEKLHKIFDVDAVTTIIGACFGATNISTYMENTAAVIEGGRTGFAAVITGVLFLLTVFIAPIAYIVPSAATATTLIISGVLMMSVIKYIDFDDEAEALPAFLTMLMIPLTYNLVTGIAFGLISYPLIKIFTGKAKEVQPLTYVLAFIFIVQIIMIY